MEKYTETITLHLMAKKYHSDEEYEYSTSTTDMSDYGYIPITTKDIEVSIDIPEDFDPVNGHIDSLKAEKQKIAAEAQLKMNNLEEQIQSLLAIECDS
jgi:hypothetical protein